MNTENKVTRLYDFQENIGQPYVVTQFDIDGDGEDEILVQSSAGTHSCKLEIYNFSQNGDDQTLVLRDSVTISTMSGYAFN